MHTFSAACGILMRWLIRRITEGSSELLIAQEKDQGLLRSIHTRTKIGGRLYTSTCFVRTSNRVPNTGNANTRGRADLTFSNCRPSRKTSFWNIWFCSFSCFHYESDYSKVAKLTYFCSFWKKVAKHNLPLWKTIFEAHSVFIMGDTNLGRAAASFCQ